MPVTSRNRRNERQTKKTTTKTYVMSTNRIEKIYNLNPCRTRLPFLNNIIVRPPKIALARRGIVYRVVHNDEDDDNDCCNNIIIVI